MVERLGRGLVFAGFLTFAGALPGAAQGALSGELVAADVAGYVVIACFADAELGCDEARSGFAEVAGGGTRAAWAIDGLERGPFLVLGWRDVDGDGEAQEHELVVLRDAAGEPRLITAPAAGLLLRAPDAPIVQDGPVRRSPAASAPATAAPAAPPAAPPAPPAAPPAPPAAPPAPPAAALHPDLVGVWQQTRASGGDYRDLATGSTFSMTSGFSSMLKLRADASFVFQFYSSGVASDCGFVTHLDTAVGRAAVEGGALVLRPDQRWVEVTACTRSGTYEPGLDPMVLPARLTESFDFDGHRTWMLALEGGPVPLELTLLHRPPSPTPPQPAQPDDFVVGTDPPYSDIQGVWAPYPGSDLGFFEPTTNAFYLPEYNGSTHQWLLASGGGPMTIEVRPATVFEDVATMVGPKRPDANVCWCLSYRIPSKENTALRRSGARRAGRRAHGVRADRGPRVRRRRGRRLGGRRAARRDDLRAQPHDPARRRPRRVVGVVHPRAPGTPRQGDLAPAARGRRRVRASRGRRRSRGTRWTTAARRSTDDGVRRHPRPVREGGLPARRPTRRRSSAGSRGC
jgi:hypothetical protein